MLNSRSKERGFVFWSFGAGTAARSAMAASASIHCPNAMAKAGEFPCRASSSRESVANSVELRVNWHVAWVSAEAYQVTLPRKCSRLPLDPSVLRARVDCHFQQAQRVLYLNRLARYTSTARQRRDRIPPIVAHTLP